MSCATGFFWCASAHTVFVNTPGEVPMFASRIERLRTAGFICHSLSCLYYTKSTVYAGWRFIENEIARHALGPISCRDDGTHAGGIVDEFEEVGFLRRVCVVNDKPRGYLPPGGVEDVACVRAADAPPPRDHLPTIAVVTEQFDNAFHAHLAFAFGFL